MKSSTSGTPVGPATLRDGGTVDADGEAAVEDDGSATVVPADEQATATVASTPTTTATPISFGERPTQARTPKIGDLFPVRLVTTGIDRLDG